MEQFMETIICKSISYQYTKFKKSNTNGDEYVYDKETGRTR